MVAAREADSQAQASAVEAASHPASVETSTAHCPPPGACEGEVDSPGVSGAHADPVPFRGLGLASFPG